MAVNRRLLKRRLNLDPGLVRKTKRRGKNHLKVFWKDSQGALKRQACEIAQKQTPFGAPRKRSNLVKFRPNFGSQGAALEYLS